MRCGASAASAVAGSGGFASDMLFEAQAAACGQHGVVAAWQMLGHVYAATRDGNKHAGSNPGTHAAEYY